MLLTLYIQISIIILLTAIDWITDEGVLALKCSKIGIILNGLTQICNATTKPQFVVGLISGLGSLLTYESRESFVKMVYLIIF